MKPFAAALLFTTMVGANHQAGSLARAAEPKLDDAAIAALPTGEWRVEFSNGVIEKSVISNMDRRYALVEEPLRRARGKVEFLHGVAVIRFEDDRVERWTRVGGRFIVEHWFPGSRFPSEGAVLGIAERGSSE